MDETTRKAACRGDRQAQGELLKALQDPWFRLCYGLLGNAEAARDATQESALRFLRALPNFRGDSQLRTWAMGIAINVAREMRRSARPVDAIRLAASAAASISPERQAESSEQAAMLRETIEHLPDRQKEAVLLRYFEDLSIEETAVAMQCAEGTVKATIHQALRSLKEHLRQLR